MKRYRIGATVKALFSLSTVIYSEKNCCLRLRWKVLRELLKNFEFREGIELKLRKEKDSEGIFLQS